MKIFSKDEFYKKVIGEHYKIGVSQIDKKDKRSDIYFSIYFKDKGVPYLFNCSIKREPFWSCDCQMINSNFDRVADKYVRPDLHIDLRANKLNSSYKLYNFIKKYYEVENENICK